MVWIIGTRDEDKVLSGHTATGGWMKMKRIVTIKGQPVIDIYESFDGSYWFAMEKAWKQNSLIGRKVHKNDQIFFGYVRLSSCPDCAEFGYFSEAEVKRLGPRVWKVDKRNWSVCPCVEVEQGSEGRNSTEVDGWGTSVPPPASSPALQEEGGR